MLREPERMARVDRYDLVDAVAEDESAVEHRYARFLEGMKLPFR